MIGFAVALLLGFISLGEERRMSWGSASSFRAGCAQYRFGRRKQATFFEGTCEDAQNDILENVIGANAGFEGDSEEPRWSTIGWFKRFFVESADG